MGKNKCNEAETECKDKQKRQSKEGQRQRERRSLETCDSPINAVAPTLLFSFLFSHSVRSNMHIRNKQE